MHAKSDNIKVLYCRALDNEYLHKDFHGGLCYAIKYLDDNYSHAVTTKYLRKVGQSCYLPLIANLKKNGLVELE